MVRILPNTTNGLYIQWDELAGEEFTISRSSSPVSGYEIIATDVSTPFFVDATVNLREIGLRHYYKIEGVVGGVKVSESVGETVIHNFRNPIANKAIYENQVVLRVMNNPPVKVLLRRRTGQHCPECWNPITKKPKYANCKVCNGTGMLTGYHEPIEVKISRSFSQLMNYSNMLDGEKVSQSNVDAWISNFPLVSPGDVIVDLTNQRFSIEQVVQRTHAQHIVRQLLDMVPLESGHPAYLVPIDWSDKK